jgi:uncharacterized membrane protein
MSAPLASDDYKHQDRIEFQIDRLILFTDAVFAIAITLLAIEIRVPELHHLSNHEAQIALLRLIPKFVGFLVGFFVIAVYWVAHHRLFRFVRHYDDRLLWLNILFLLSIVLMPFTSGFYSEYTTLNTPFILYCISVMATGLLQMRLQSALRNPSRGYVHPSMVAHPDLDLVRPLVAIVAFGLSILLAMATPLTWPSRMVPILIFPMMMLYARRHRRLQREFEARATPTPEATEVA